MSNLLLTVNDTAPVLTGTVNAVITGATLAIHVKKPDGTLINRAGTIVSGVAGTWSLALQAGDLNQSGVYLVEVQVTYSGGSIQTFAHNTRSAPESFTVRNELA